MKKEGYKSSTIERRAKILKVICRKADLKDAEAVKKAISEMDWSEGTEELGCDAYALLARSLGFAFQKPRYERIEKIPCIPLETEIDALISGTGPKTSAVLQLLKETGARIGEAWTLKWSDIDLERGIVTITPEKGSYSRQLKISSKVCGMLSRLPRKSTRIFGWANLDSFRREYEKQRKKIAFKLNNPRLCEIRLHTFRHFKATMEYHKTKDILHVQRLLGHRNIMHTLTYTRLVDWKSDEFVCKVAKSLDEATGLIEAGFDYVTELDGVKLFRRRK